MDRLFGLALLLLLLSLSVVCWSAKQEDGGRQLDHTKGELSRPKRSQEGLEHCSCPSLHEAPKQKKHRRVCPCDGINLSRLEQLHHHHHGKTKRHMQRKRQACKKFLKRCYLTRLQIPL